MWRSKNRVKLSNHHTFPWSFSSQIPLPVQFAKKDSAASASWAFSWGLRQICSWVAPVSWLHDWSASRGWHPTGGMSETINTHVPTIPKSKYTVDHPTIHQHCKKYIAGTFEDLKGSMFVGRQAQKAEKASCPATLTPSFVSFPAVRLHFVVQCTEHMSGNVVPSRMRAMLEFAANWFRTTVCYV